MSHEMSSSIIHRSSENDDDPPLHSLSTDTNVSKIRPLSSGDHQMKALALRRGRTEGGEDEDDEDWDLEENENDALQPIETEIRSSSHPPPDSMLIEKTDDANEDETAVVDEVDVLREIPVLHRTDEGEVVLRFSQLFAHCLVLSRR
jgi:hypothetical protein